MPLDILLVDDEPTLRLVVGDKLAAAGHRVEVASDGARAMERLAERVYDVVICDLLLPKVGGMRIFEHLRREAPGTDVILITGQGSVPDAVQALRNGAVDYLTKPFDLERLLHELVRVEEQRELARELRRVKSALLSAGGAGLGAMVGRSTVMQRLFERVETLAGSDAPVLITGESGTGKELVARALHERSPRAGRPLVTVNCAAFPETLLEAELFGHERGAFTGAFKKRDGRFRVADGGTLFLDEVAEIPPQAQVKLLRVLQEGAFQPLGSNETVKVNVRIISATHQPLKQLVADHRFREDLYYRLRVLDVRLPPLRERRGDIPVLVEHFLGRFSAERRITGLTPRAWAVLLHHAWPGNVRELEHAIHHACVLAGGGEIDAHHLPDELADVDPDDASLPLDGGIQPLATALREFEREYLQRALDAFGGNRTRTAEKLGISRKNLWEKLRTHGLKPAGDGRAED